MGGATAGHRGGVDNGLAIVVMDWDAVEVFTLAGESSCDLDRPGLRLETVSRSTNRVDVDGPPEYRVIRRIVFAVLLAPRPVFSLML